MKRVESQNLSIAFEDEGEGNPVVMIHGYPLNRQIWRSQWEGLADNARIIAPDLRNHGETIVYGQNNLSETTHSMDLLAEDLAQLLDALRISSPVIVNGLSMGGYAAFAFYRKYPERVRGLILTATRARSDSEAEIENRIKAINIAQNQGVGAIVVSMLPRLVSPNTIMHNSDLVERIREIMLSSSIEGLVGDLRGMMARLDSIPLLWKIRIPSLVLAGRDDQIIPIVEAQAMNDLISDSRLEIIDNAGHLLNMEQPELYNRIVREFILSLK
jgi:3-oxoadipate enol-lactonase